MIEFYSINISRFIHFEKKGKTKEDWHRTKTHLYDIKLLPGCPLGPIIPSAPGIPSLPG